MIEDGIYSFSEDVEIDGIEIKSTDRILVTKHNQELIPVDYEKLDNLCKKLLEQGMTTEEFLNQQMPGNKLPDENKIFEDFMNAGMTMIEDEGYNTIQNFEYIMQQIEKLDSSEFYDSIISDLVSALKIVESLYRNYLKK